MSIEGLENPIILKKCNNQPDILSNYKFSSEIFPGAFKVIPFFS